MISAGSIVGKKNLKDRLETCLIWRGRTTCLGNRHGKQRRAECRRKRAFWHWKKQELMPKRFDIYTGETCCGRELQLPWEWRHFRFLCLDFMGLALLQGSTCTWIYGSGGGVWRIHACGDIEPLWKCRERIPVSAGICQSEAAVCPLDCNRERRLFNRKETESCESVRSNRWKDC